MIELTLHPTWPRNDNWTYGRFRSTSYKHRRENELCGWLAGFVDGYLSQFKV